MNSAGGRVDFIHAGFPIRRPTDRRLLTAPRGFSQFCHVLHRLLVPRHPPNALTSLTTKVVTHRIAPMRSGKGPSRSLRSPSLGCAVSAKRQRREYPNEVARSFLLSR